MKRLFAIFIVLVLMASGCAVDQKTVSTPAQTIAASSPTANGSTKPYPIKKIRYEFKSIVDFCYSLKDGPLDEYLVSLGIDSYWVPSTLPFNARLQYILVGGSYIYYSYEFIAPGEKEPIEYHTLGWTWHFGELYDDAAGYLQMFKDLGRKELGIKNELRRMICVGEAEYPSVPDPASDWECDYTQDGVCFSVEFPCIFGIDTIEQMLVMEKKKIY